MRHAQRVVDNGDAMSDETVIEFRPFHPDDTEAVVALWQRCDLTRPWNGPREERMPLHEIG